LTTDSIHWYERAILRQYTSHNLESVSTNWSIFSLVRDFLCGSNGLGGTTVTPLLFTLWRDEVGQDLIEYTLLLAFLLFCVIGMVGFGGASIRGIVSTSNSQISAGNVFAQGG